MANLKSGLLKTSSVTGQGELKIKSGRKRRSFQATEVVPKDQQRQMTKPKVPSTPTKHVPTRTCVACRKESAKRELVRLVRAADGSVEIDVTGKKSGRGAYLCLSQECWNDALKGGRLEYALGARIKPGNREMLANYAKAINNTDGIVRS